MHQVTVVLFLVTCIVTLWCVMKPLSHRHHGYIPYRMRTTVQSIQTTAVDTGCGDGTCTWCSRVPVVDITPHRDPIPCTLTVFVHLEKTGGTSIRDVGYRKDPNTGMDVVGGMRGDEAYKRFSLGRFENQGKEGKEYRLLAVSELEDALIHNETFIHQHPHILLEFHAYGEAMTEIDRLKQIYHDPTTVFNSQGCKMITMTQIRDPKRYIISSVRKNLDYHWFYKGLPVYENRRFSPKNDTYLEEFEKTKFDLVNMQCESLSRYLSYSNEYRYQYACGATRMLELLDSFDLVGTTECLSHMINVWGYMLGNPNVSAHHGIHDNAQTDLDWHEFERAVDAVVELSECDKAIYAKAAHALATTLQGLMPSLSVF